MSCRGQTWHYFHKVLSSGLLLRQSEFDIAYNNNSRSRVILLTHKHVKSSYVSISHVILEEDLNKTILQFIKYSKINNGAIRRSQVLA